MGRAGSGCGGLRQRGQDGAVQARRLDPELPGFLDDPYPSYSWFRAHDPVHYDPVADVWILFGYADCASWLRRTDVVVAPERAFALRPRQQRRRLRALRSAMPEGESPRPDRSVFQSDPPDHGRLREVLSRGFADDRMARLEDFATGEVERLIGRWADGDPDAAVDVMETLAFPLHTGVVHELLGFPHADEYLVRSLSHRAVMMADPTASVDGIADGMRATNQLRELCEDRIAWKRSHPGDDLVTDLLAAKAGGASGAGPRISPDELVDQVVLVYLAGLESTANLIGNGLRALLGQPTELQRWHADASLTQGAVDELLRFDSPVQFTRRVPLTDVVLGERNVPAGAYVIAWTGSANRDPEMFGADADRLRLDRPNASRHLSFGGGIHLCLGGPLSRLEGALALGSIVRHFPRISAAGPPVGNGRLMLRGLDQLPVRLGSRAG